jgi:hypothetical protein
MMMQGKSGDQNALNSMIDQEKNFVIMQYETILQ